VIHHVVFQISDADAALSWHLTHKQQEFIKSAVPVDACGGSNCSDSNATSGKTTIKSLDDAVAWFSAAQQQPNTPPATDVCRVYPD
jgi:hypothetical protein